MTLGIALHAGTMELKRGLDHRDSAALDAELLLARVMDVPREELYTHPERRLTKRQVSRFESLVRRRIRHEPVAYILGEKEFYGLRLNVTRDVLIPRPETEGLVEAALKAIPPLHLPPSEKGGERGGMSVIVDIGTGSGAVAIAIARSFPSTSLRVNSLRMTKGGFRMTSIPRIIATDVSRRAIAVARENARRHGVADRIRFVRCDLLPRVTHPNPLFSREGVVIVANLPYLPTKLWRQTSPEIKKYEPRSALDGGKDGLDVYRRLLDRLPPLHLPPARRGEKKNFFPPSKRGEYKGGSWTLITELLPSQMRTFSSEVRKRFSHARVQRVAPMVIQVNPALN